MESQQISSLPQLRHALTPSPPAKGDPGIAGHTSADCVQSLQRIEGLLAGRMNNRFRPYGLSTATFNVLLVLSRAGGSLSPRGDWRAPSDGNAAAWLAELERNVPL